MHTAAITSRNGHLEAHEQNDARTVRLANREARARHLDRYLDLAIAELLANVGIQPGATPSLLPSAQPRKQRRVLHGGHWKKPLALGLRAMAFARVARTARLAKREARAHYLDLDIDLAIAELLADVGIQPGATPSPLASAQPRKQRRVLHGGHWKKPLALGLRAMAFALVAGTAFMLTTWLNTLW
jgi:hypothetical protein